MRILNVLTSREPLGEDSIDHSVGEADALDGLWVVVCTHDLKFQSVAEHWVGSSTEKAVHMIGES